MKTHRAQRRILVSISYLLQIPNAVDEAGYSTSKMYYSRKYWNYICFAIRKLYGFSLSAPASNQFFEFGICSSSQNIWFGALDPRIFWHRCTNAELKKLVRKGDVLFLISVIVCSLMNVECVCMENQENNIARGGTPNAKHYARINKYVDT
jgi:hypothetical protein